MALRLVSILLVSNLFTFSLVKFFEQKVFRYGFYLIFDLWNGIKTYDQGVTSELRFWVFILKLPEQIIPINKLLWTELCTRTGNWACTKETYQLKLGNTFNHNWDFISEWPWPILLIFDNSLALIYRLTTIFCKYLEFNRCHRKSWFEVKV